MVRGEVYLSLWWSTKAIAMQFPDNNNIDISSSLIDLHCEKEDMYMNSKWQHNYTSNEEKWWTDNSAIEPEMENYPSVED